MTDCPSQGDLGIVIILKSFSLQAMPARHKMALNA